MSGAGRRWPASLTRYMRSEQKTSPGFTQNAPQSMTMIGRKRGWVIKLTCGSAKILAMSHVKKMIIKIDLKEESPEKE